MSITSLLVVDFSTVNTTFPRGGRIVITVMHSDSFIASARIASLSASVVDTWRSAAVLDRSTVATELRKVISLFIFRAVLLG